MTELMSCAPKDDVLLERQRTHDHVSSRPAAPGRLEAHRNISRYADSDQVPEGDCGSKLENFICRSISEICSRYYLLYVIQGITECQHYRRCKCATETERQDSKTDWPFVRHCQHLRVGMGLLKRSSSHWMVCT